MDIHHSVVVLRSKGTLKARVNEASRRIDQLATTAEFDFTPQWARFIGGAGPPKGSGSTWTSTTWTTDEPVVSTYALGE